MQRHCGNETGHRQTDPRAEALEDILAPRRAVGATDQVIELTS
jgi:hypothetical protein